MANQAKVMGQVTQAVNFMIDKVKDDIVSSNQERELNLTTEQMRNLLTFVEASMKDAYNRSMDQIINAIDWNDRNQAFNRMSLLFKDI